MRTLKTKYLHPRLLFALFVFGTLMLMVTSYAQPRPATKKPTGTYSNMYFNEEGGDVLGEELKIVQARSGYQAVLQTAEGEPSDLAVVSLQITADRISFVVPDAFPYAGEFSGTLRNGSIEGVFKFKNGVTKNVTLKKGKSYWD